MSEKTCGHGRLTEKVKLPCPRICDCNPHDCDEVETQNLMVHLFPFWRKLTNLHPVKCVVRWQYNVSPDTVVIQSLAAYRMLLLA